MGEVITGVHPYADKYPMLGDAELSELAESIRENGQRQPIVLTPDGLILDGRNRAKACELAGVEPTCETYEGDDLAEYVIDCNSSRRHMSTGARAMATALVLLEAKGRENGRWNRRGPNIGAITESGNSDSRWRNALNQSGTILDHAPALAREVVDGHLALDAAYRKACEARDSERLKLEREEREQLEEAENAEFLRERDPEFAAEVESSGWSWTAGRAEWDRRNREEAERIRREKAEREKREREERQARTDFYSGIAKGLQTLSLYGGYDNIPDKMRDYNPSELSPTTLSEQFTTESLHSAARLIAGLIEWSESNV